MFAVIGGEGDGMGPRASCQDTKFPRPSLAHLRFGTLFKVGLNGKMPHAHAWIPLEVRSMFIWEGHEEACRFVWGKEAIFASVGCLLVPRQT